MCKVSFTIFQKIWRQEEQLGEHSRPDGEKYVE